MKAWHNMSGFTLLELMVVLAIVSVATAVVAPQVFSTSDNQQRAAVREIQGAYLAARDVATTRGRLVLLRSSSHVVSTGC